jgi:hypothetical protein
MTSTGQGLAPNRLIRSSQFWQLELAFRRAHARTGVGPHGRGQLRRHVWQRPCFLPIRTVASWVCVSAIQTCPLAATRRQYGYHRA